MRSIRLQPSPDPVTAAAQFYTELENVRLRNAPWWAAESRPYYAALLRWYRSAGAPPHPDPAGPPAIAGNSQHAASALLGAQFATCYYQLRLFARWEEQQRADRLTPARDVEKALRWDGYALSNSGFGYRRVIHYLKSQAAREQGPP